MEPNDTRNGSLATSRPWLSVAGCLGSGVVGAFFLLLVVVAVVLFVFFPPFGGIDPKKVVFLTALGELQKSPALRVATREIAVQVDASVPTEATVRPWILPFGPGFPVEVGRTRATILAPGNIVQYVVRLDDPDGSPQIEFEAEDLVVVTLPAPEVDEALVEVQSDPARLELSLDRSGFDRIVLSDAARDAAMRDIRAAVVRAAASEPAMFEVRAKARAEVAEMIRALVPERWRSQRIAVRWRDDPDPG